MEYAEYKRIAGSKKLKANDFSELSTLIDDGAYVLEGEGADPSNFYFGEGSARKTQEFLAELDRMGIDCDELLSEVICAKNYNGSSSFRGFCVDNQVHVFRKKDKRFSAILKNRWKSAA